MILRQESPCVAQGAPLASACSTSGNTGIFHYAGLFFFLIIEGRKKILLVQDVIYLIFYKSTIYKPSISPIKSIEDPKDSLEYKAPLFLVIYIASLLREVSCNVSLVLTEYGDF